MRKKLQQAIHLCDLGDLASPNNDWRHTGPLVGVGFCLLVYYVTLFSQALLSFENPLPFFDFGSLYASVYAWVHHMNPYLDYPLTYKVPLDVSGKYVPSINLNPPISLYLFRPLVAFGPITSAELWATISLLLLCISLILVIRANPNPAFRSRILLILGMAGIWETFEAGQVYMILLLLTVVAWLSFRKNNFITAGIAIGILCALKPNFLVWPVLLILARHRKAGISAIMTFATASVFPLMFRDGLQLYRQWIDTCRKFNGIGLISNSSIVAMFMRLDPYLGTTHHFRDMGYAVTIVMLLAIAWITWRTSPEVFRTSEIALVVSLLAGPLTWLGYTIVLIPMLYERRLNTLIRVGWVILCIPMPVLAWIAVGSRAQIAIMGAPYFYSLVLIGTALLWELYSGPVPERTLSNMKLATLSASETSAPTACNYGAFNWRALFGSSHARRD